MSAIRLRLWTYPCRFRFRFSHAAAARAEAENVICEAADRDGVVGYGEGCPRAYVSGETMESAAAFFSAHRASLEENAGSLTGLRRWITAHEKEIDAAPAVFAAIEGALLDRLARRAGQSIETLLGLPSGASLPATGVLGTGGPARLAGLAFRCLGLQSAKLKLSEDAAADARRLRRFRAGLGDGADIRLDANGAFADGGAAIAALRDMSGDAWAVEEPVRAFDFEGMAAIARETGLAIILDESCGTADHLGQARAAAADVRWILNLRVSRHGGLIRALRLGRAAAAIGVDAIVGAQVGETSLLARQGLALAAGLPSAPLGVELGYGPLLLQKDLTRPGVGIGLGGRIRPSQQFFPYVAAERLALIVD